MGIDHTARTDHLSEVWIVPFDDLLGISTWERAQKNVPKNCSISCTKMYISRQVKWIE